MSVLRRLPPNGTQALGMCWQWDNRPVIDLRWLDVGTWSYGLIIVEPDGPREVSEAQASKKFYEDSLVPKCILISTIPS